jgi:hypothetical protein
VLAYPEGWQGGEAAAPVAWALRGDPLDYTAELRSAVTRREEIGGGARRTDEEICGPYGAGKLGRRSGVECGVDSRL